MRVPWKQAAALAILPTSVLIWNAYVYSRSVGGSVGGSGAAHNTGAPQHSREGGGAAGSDTESFHDVEAPQQPRKEGRPAAEGSDGGGSGGSGGSTPPNQDTGAPQHHHQAVNDVHEVAAAAAARGPGIVQLNFMGRLGNNLFEYAAARALADRLGWALSIQPAKANVKKFGLLTRPEGMACFPGVRPVGPPASSPEMAGLETVKYRGGLQELEDPAPRSIEMQGWYQDYGLFRSEKERLRKVCKVSSAKRSEATRGEASEEERRGARRILCCSFLVLVATSVCLGVARLRKQHCSPFNTFA